MVGADARRGVCRTRKQWWRRIGGGKNAGRPELQGERLSVQHQRPALGRLRRQPAAAGRTRRPRAVHRGDPGVRPAPAGARHAGRRRTLRLGTEPPAHWRLRLAGEIHQPVAGTRGQHRYSVGTDDRGQHLQRAGQHHPGQPDADAAAEKTGLLLSRKPAVHWRTARARHPALRGMHQKTEAHIHA